MNNIYDRESEENNYYLLGTTEVDGIQILVEVFSDGQLHVATRAESHDSWSPGAWTIIKKVNLNT